jgi:ubiquinol-cytochrome c reductase iron-sulfur subunit
MSGNEPVRRRDLLTTAAFSVAGVGGLLALWPFVAALAPDAETRARQTHFDLAELKGIEPKTIAIGGRPVMIFRRSEADVGGLQKPPYGQSAGFALRDRDSEKSSQPAWAKNWHRSFRPEIMVCLPICTRGDCLVSRAGGIGSADALLCPCCGSRFDLAGRVYAGPARSNLAVPPHRFVGPGTVEFFEHDTLTTPV